MIKYLTLVVGKIGQISMVYQVQMATRLKLVDMQNLPLVLGNVVEG